MQNSGRLNVQIRFFKVWNRVSIVRQNARKQKRGFVGANARERTFLARLPLVAPIGLYCFASADVGCLFLLLIYTKIFSLKFVQRRKRGKKRMFEIDRRILRALVLSLSLFSSNQKNVVFNAANAYVRLPTSEFLAPELRAHIIFSLGARTCERLNAQTNRIGSILSTCLVES